MKKGIKKKHLKAYFPELYAWIYGTPKTKKSLLKRIRLKAFFKWFAIEFNSVYNSVYYFNLVRKANLLHKNAKPTTHRHVVPFTKTKCGIITGADLVTYNKMATQRGLKKLRYKTLKKEAYFSTDTLTLK